MVQDKVIYADYSASTPPHPEVIRTMSEVMEQIYANPSSIHQFGGQAEQLVTRARGVIADALKVNPTEVLFTSGATESNNMAVLGAVRASRYSKKPAHAIVSAIEHASVYACYEQLKREGVEVTILPVDSNGCVRPEDVAQALLPETIIVSVMHVNNEMGAIQPLEQIGTLMKQHPKAVLHVDGVQGLGKLEVDLDRWNTRLFSLSGHKIRGPKGVGVLIRRGRVPLEPLLHGGSQEQGLRAGTLNVPGIVALAKAVRMAVEGQADNKVKLEQLQRQLIRYVSDIPELVLNSPTNAQGAPHIVNMSFPGMKSEVVVHALEERGVIASTQSACSSKLHKPSRVLLAMTNNDRVASSGIRISLDAEMSMDDIDRIGQALHGAVNQLRPLVQLER
ncbi:cysteine desulfurase family protein [Paenibacillus taiwanensis]|uniref:cysteine desulfurase family protein n=1 Tax=Paenibacillus taiwanensis TaxID=401638 RepID=UPI0004188571|nr:cysteine desulfurase family protein [Paenibacillus taiwanensis]